MGFLDKIFKRGHTSLTWGGVGVDEPVQIINHNSNVLNECGAAFTAVDKVAKACMTTEMYSSIGDEIVKTEADRLFASPALDISPDRFIYQLVNDIFTGGFAFVVLIGNVKSRVVEMRRIDARKCGILVDGFGDDYQVNVMNDKYQGSYIYDNGRFLNPQNPFVEIVIIKHPSGSLLNPFRLEIDVLKNGLKKNGQLIKNGGRVSMLLTFKDGVDADELQSRINGIERTIQGKGYGGILGVTGGENGVEAKEMGLSPKDMDFATFQNFCRLSLFVGVGVPLPLIDNSASTYENMRTAQYQMATDTVLPLCDLIYNAIGKIIALRENGDYQVWTDRMSVPAISERVTDEIIKLKEVTTLNERRAKLMLEAQEGGDDLLVEGRMVKLSDLGVGL